MEHELHGDRFSENFKNDIYMFQQIQKKKA
jgi:hypothetical protein